MIPGRRHLRIPELAAQVKQFAGVVSAERRGPFIYYRLADASLFNLLEACARYAETLKEPRTAAFQWPPWEAMCRMMRPRRR